MIVAANPAIADATTAPTNSATGGGATGGLLAAGTYQTAYAWVDAFGVTKTSTRSSTLTVGSTNIPRVTVPSLPTGAVEWWLYATAVNDPTGTLYLYATGCTGTTWDMTVATADSSDPLAVIPTVNTTGLTQNTNMAYEILSGLLSGNPEPFMSRVLSYYNRWNSGAPMSRMDARLLARRNAGVMTVLAQIANEASALILANPGTLGYASGPINSRPVRTWP